MLGSEHKAYDKDEPIDIWEKMGTRLQDRSANDVVGRVNGGTKVGNYEEKVKNN